MNTSPSPKSVMTSIKVTIRYFTLWKEVPITAHGVRAWSIKLQSQRVIWAEVCKELYIKVQTHALTMVNCL